MGYRYNDSGFTSSRDKHEKQRVFAPKKGFPGHMIPGDPTSWVGMDPKTAKHKEALKLKVEAHNALKPIQPKPGMATEVPNVRDFQKQWDKEMTAPTKKEEDLKEPNNSTRDTPSPNGGSGSGTRTSPGGGRPILDAAGAQAFYQSVGLGGFMSNKLPGTTSSPDVKGTIEAVPFGGQETSVTENTLGAFNGVGGNAMADLNPTIGAGAFTNPEVMKAVGSTMDQYGGLAQGNNAFSKDTQGTKSYEEISPTDPIAAEAFGEDWVKSNGGGSSRLNEALNDTAGINSYMSKFGSPEQDRMRAANMAFLNNEDSMMGLRAKEAVLGGIQAGGQYYQLNEGRDALISGEDGKPIAADPDKKRAFMSGNLSATEFRDSFKDQVKAVAAGADKPIVTPKAGENPFAQLPTAASTEFPTDISAGTFAPATTEVGEMIDTVKAMDMTPAISSQQISNSFLNQREPLMRDPRKR